MNKNKIALAIMAFISLDAAAAAAKGAATDVSWQPKMYGGVQAQVTQEKGMDIQTEVQQANIGFKGVYTADEELKVQYNIRLQYADDNKRLGTDKLQVVEAVAILMTKSYGGFLIGDSVTGTWNDMYSRVDIHYANNMETFSGADLFEQGKYGTNQFAYFTPKWDMGSGKLWFKLASITAVDSNDTDGDAIGLRALYNAKNFNFVVNYTHMNDEMLRGAAYDPTKPGTNKNPEEKDFGRIAIAGDVTFNNLTLAALAEINSDAAYFKKADATYALAAKYKLNKYEFGISHQMQSFDQALKDTYKIDDNSLTIASVKYHYTPQLAFFVEGAIFDSKPVAQLALNEKNQPNNKLAAVNDNFNIGMQFKF